MAVTHFERPPTFDVKIVGGKKIIIWNKNKKNQQKSENLPSEISTSSNPATEGIDTAIATDKETKKANENDRAALEPVTEGQRASTSSELKLNYVSRNEDRIRRESGDIAAKSIINIDDKESDENLPKIKSAENSPMKRRSVSPPSLSSSFKVLPPIKTEFEEDRPVETYDFEDEEDLSSFCQLRLREVSSRTLDVCLLELRKIDRDRDKIIHPTTITKFVTKYNLPIMPCLDNLYRKFESKQFADLVNYENLMHYFNEKREEGRKKKETWPHIQDYFDRKPVRNGTVTVRKARIDGSRPSEVDSVTPPPRKLVRSQSWTEEKESSLVAEMSRALEKTTVDVERLAEVMRSKDHYGNDQLSGQQVQDSLRGLRLDKSLVNRLMKAADMIGRGIYSIPVILDIMKLAINNNSTTTDKNNKLRNDRNHHKSQDFNNNNNNYSDTTWRNILDLNNSLPKMKGRRNSLDREMKLKNVMRLKTAMYASYNQHQGYLPPKDVVQLTLAYSTVFHLEVDPRTIRDAVEKCLGGRNSLVNVEIFIKYVLDIIM